MVEYEIEGILVNFPFEAYPCQIKYMERVIACLNQGWNGVLESPTGTGKTLCLLCACLAWQQNQKRLKLAEAAAEQLGSYTQVLAGKASVPSTTTNQCITYPKILYTSRTHMQLSQVVRELNKTVYKSVKTCLMGSRDQLCLHEDVKNEQNSSIKNHMCRAKVKSRTCHFYNGFDAYQNGAKSLDTGSSGSKSETGSKQERTAALDIEDFISFGKRHKICPFFLSREKPEEADLILMPYQYVVDVKARKANKIDLNNVILIFDEAHNLEKICEESASVTFTTRDIAGSIRESKEALNMIILEEEALRREMDETNMAFGTTTDDDISKINIDTKELADLIMLLESLDKEIQKIDLKKGKDKSNQNSLPGLTVSGSFLLDVLQNAGINALMRDGIYNLIDKLTSYLTVKATNSIWQSRGASLQRVASFFNTIFSADDDAHEAANVMDTYKNHSRHFKVYVSAIEEERRGSTTLNNFVKSNARHQNLQLDYWCFNAGLTMQSLVEKGVSSVLVTSGTLSPINHFQAEMKIPFQIALQNDHVVKKEQTWFGVICQGPDGCPLDASYQNRQNETYILSLGNMLVNIFRLVPEGCLVFFASYAPMNTCIEKWQNTGIWSRMANHKSLYVEPRSKDEFYRTLSEYNDVVKRKPAAFFAVCRGKVSEGIDFADSAARAVVMMGIPYPPMYDPRVVLKKEFLGRQQSERSGAEAASNPKMLIDGETWYRTEAIRAINQSIGRVIRHKDDYGAVILADQRFTTWNRDRFPSWIVPNYCAYNKFGEFSKSLAQFFKDKGPKVEPKLTSVIPKESGFEKNSTLRQRDAEERRMNDRFNPKKPKLDMGPPPDYFGLSLAAQIPPMKPKPQPIYANMWDALENGKQVTEVETFAPYKPAAVNQTKPIEGPSRRQKIVIKKDAGDGKANGTGGESSTKKEEDLQKSKEYVKLIKRRLAPERYEKLFELVKAYKNDRRFEPVLMFMKELPFEECIDVIKGFIIFVSSQHKNAYLSFIDEAEKKR